MMGFLMILIVGLTVDMAMWNEQNEPVRVVC